jgi:hypothetical protein
MLLTVDLDMGVIMRQPNRWDGGVDPNAGYDGVSPNGESCCSFQDMC